MLHAAIWLLRAVTSANSAECGLSALSLQRHRVALFITRRLHHRYFVGTLFSAVALSSAVVSAPGGPVQHTRCDMRLTFQSLGRPVAFAVAEWRENVFAAQEVVRSLSAHNRSRPSHAAPPRRHPIVQHITLVTYPHVMRHPPCIVPHTCVTQHACPTAPVRRSSTSRHCHRRSRVSPHSCSHILWSCHSILCRKRRRRRRRRRRQRQAAMPIKAPRRAAQSINS